MDFLEKNEISIISLNQVYFGNKLSAAFGFAKDIVRYNQECLKHPIENKRFYDNTLLGRLKDNFDKKSSFVLDAVGPYLCYLTSINSFVYASLKLKYSKPDQGYTFSKKPENKLSIVG